MDAEFKDRFLQYWNQHFPVAELPIGFFYSRTAEPQSMARPPKGHRCMIGDLKKVRDGKTLCFNNDTIGCGGGKRYLGFESMSVPDVEYFLSYGIPDKLEGERYKKSPEIVKETMKHQKPFNAPAQNIIFKRWDKLEDRDDPLVIIFFATPDVLSGLFTLANFDEPQPYGVMAPFCAGCASIVHYPYQELNAPAPRAVLGMFDVSARPCVSSSHLTFAVPWPKFERMVNNMKESFLITNSWDKVKARIKRDSESS